MTYFFLNVLCNSGLLLIQIASLNLSALEKFTVLQNIFYIGMKHPSNS